MKWSFAEFLNFSKGGKGVILQFLNKYFEVVIFDMDGTMFDTERLRFKMLKEASLQLYGEEMSEQLLYDSLGVSAVTGEELAKQRYGNDYPYKGDKEKSFIAAGSINC